MIGPSPVTESRVTSHGFKCPATSSVSPSISTRSPASSRAGRRRRRGSRAASSARASGAPRLLALFRKYGIRTTWLRPGPHDRDLSGSVEAVVEAGHEIAHHGWTHRPPATPHARTRKRKSSFAATSRSRKLGAQGPRLPLAVVGPQPAFGRAVAQARLRVRQQHDGRRLHAVLRAAGRRDRAAEARRIRQGQRRSWRCRSTGPPTIRRISSSCAPRPACARA